MTAVSHPAAQSRRQQDATRIVFLIAGFAMSAWAPLVPFARDRLGIDDGTLGVLLLCLGAGSFVAMPLAGAAAARFGCRAVIVASIVLTGIALPALAWLSSLPAFAITLVLFGAGIGTLDVTMNIQAIIVERESRRTMMSGFHGLFSVGGILGAMTVTGLLALGATPIAAAAIVVWVIMALLVAASPYLLARATRSDGPSVAWPKGAVALLGALCFIAFLAEGAVLDWGALFLVRSGFVDASQGGLGYAAFSCAMTLCRLTGDSVVRRFGPVALVTGGGLIAAAGLLLVTQAPVWPMALSGFMLVGVGCANIVPVLFSAAGRQTDMPEALAVPAMTSLGYAGILAGPAAIGLIAQHASLSTALLTVAALLVAVAASGRLLPR